MGFVTHAFFLAILLYIGYNTIRKGLKGCENVLSAVEGYYNGTQIVLDESVALHKGQRVIITILDPLIGQTKQNVNLKKYMGRGEKMFNCDAGQFVKELRSDDRV